MARVRINQMENEKKMRAQLELIGRLNQLSDTHLMIDYEIRDSKGNRNEVTYPLVLDRSFRCFDSVIDPGDRIRVVGYHDTLCHENFAVEMHAFAFNKTKFEGTVANVLDKGDFIFFDLLARDGTSMGCSSRRDRFNAKEGTRVEVSGLLAINQGQNGRIQIFRFEQ